jgi:DNA-binding transcriptional ArsR family regulator
LFLTSIHKDRFIGYHSYKGFFMYVGQERRLLPGYFQALAHPTRLRILERLAEGGELSVNELTRYLRMSQPRVSWHLGMLRRGGAVRQRKEGRQVYCSLDLDEIRRRQLAFWQMLTEKKRIGGIP